MILSAPQARVLGALVEKQLTTPQQYPLTANALVLACNQASNRQPVVAYSEGEVAAALDALREQRLVRFVLPSHGRSVVRYRQVLDEVLGLDERQLALLAVLLLRGPQTAAELRTRSERMVTFEAPGEVEEVLASLASFDDPLVERVDRRPGQKEERWVELLQGPPAAPTGASDRAAPPPLSGPAADPAGGAGGLAGQVAVLRGEVAALRDELSTYREELAALRASLGG